jgi:predicted nucleic acid-binding protein
MSEKNLLLGDADVFIHFFRGGQLQLLPKILPNKLCLLDAVAEELSRGGNLHARLKKVIGEHIHEINFDDNPAVRAEFFRLVKSGIGEGESACMALARYEGHYIASSNLRDIREYCQEHKIRIYTTMNLLHEANKRELLSTTACNSFVTDVLTAGSRLPCTSFDDFLNKKAYSPWNKYDLAK